MERLWCLYGYNYHIFVVIFHFPGDVHAQRLGVPSWVPEFIFLIIYIMLVSHILVFILLFNSRKSTEQGTGSSLIYVSRHMEGGNLQWVWRKYPNLYHILWFIWFIWFFWFVWLTTKEDFFTADERGWGNLFCRIWDRASYPAKLPRIFDAGEGPDRGIWDECARWHQRSPTRAGLRYFCPERGMECRLYWRLIPIQPTNIFPICVHHFFIRVHPRSSG